MHWFICRYYFVRNVHCTEQLRQLETRAAQSFSGAKANFWGGPFITSPTDNFFIAFMALSLLHAKIQKNDWPSSQNNCSPQNNCPPQIAPFSPPPPLGGPVSNYFFSASSMDLLSRLSLLWVSWSLSYSL